MVEIFLDSHESGPLDLYLYLAILGIISGFHSTFGSIAQQISRYIGIGIFSFVWFMIGAKNASKFNLLLYHLM